jgi:hypothetical protein
VLPPFGEQYEISRALLQAAINRFVRDHNAENPKPLIWSADPDDIIAARKRGFQTLKSIHCAVDHNADAGRPLDVGAASREPASDERGTENSVAG